MKKFILLVFSGFFGVTYISGSVSYAGSTVVVSVDQTGKTGNNGSNESAISADGRYVAFRSDASNLVPGDKIEHMQIFVHNRQTGATEIVSKGSGTMGNSYSGQVAISADGRFVAFMSAASNLVLDDTNKRTDVFVHDRQTGTIEIVSKGSGTIGNGHSAQPAISADGRFVAFRSDASNLVPGDTNGMMDIFIHDRQTGATEIVSKDSNGNLGNSYSGQAAISADGGFVAFVSAAANLVPGDTNERADIFVHDRKTGTTKIASKDGKGRLGNDSSDEPAISADGRFVAFQSAASNLVPGDKNNKEDIFVHDRKTGTTKIASKNSKGKLGNDDSAQPSISADGRYVAFESTADNLVPGDKNGTGDAFVHDRQTGRTKIVSVDSAGKLQVNGGRCFMPAISRDGRYVAFESEAGNLVPGDTNGKSDVFVHIRD